MKKVKEKSDFEQRFDGVAIGMLLEIQDGRPKVIFPANPSDAAILASTLIPLKSNDIGAEVALGFEGGDPSKPMILGRLLRPFPAVEPVSDVTLEVDDAPTPLEITGEQEITLRCGKASITLTKAGKIILRGTYISSRSSGMHRIKGGSVQLN